MKTRPENLNPSFPINIDIHEPGLLVRVDLAWFGRVMTQPNAGIKHHPLSHHSNFVRSDDSTIIL